VTRILYWNISNFSRGKILREDPPVDHQQSVDRLGHIVSQVLAPNPPDLFLLVEAYARVREVGFQGSVIHEDAAVGFGLLLLLDEIRARLSNYWCLAPPLNIGNFGYRESVGVYYNAQTLQFAGPWIFSQPTANDVALARPVTPANVAGLRNYVADWRDAMPHPNNPIGVLQMNRTWTPGGGVNINEWQSAGQWEYQSGGTRMNFPDVDSRSPLHTDFLEVGGAGRGIRLFTVHTSPASAVDATRDIGLIPEVNAFPANTVSVVIGDFNVDSFNTNENGAYTNLDNHYEMVLDPRVGTVLTPARKPYCMTHLLPADLATPFNNTGGVTDPQHNVYPRRGYTGSVDIFPRQANDSGAIDNAFVHYAGGLVPAPRNTTIVNTIAGKPYTQQPAPVGVGPELTGGNAYPTSLANAIPATGVNPPVDTIGFPNWGNFGKVRSTSDHLALSVDV
jgi:hypothetical protein